jgi:hypothetical protein
MSFETILGALLGAIFSYYLPKLIAWGNLRQRHNFSGEWLSTWEPKSEGRPEWVSEKMTIGRKLDVVELTNYENEYGYNYKCKGKLILGKHITGEWASTNNNAHSSGAFILTITPQGNCMYGQIVGPNDEGIVNAGKFVLGKTAEDIEFGKAMLDKHGLTKRRN